MNLRVALTQSIENNEPLAALGKLLSDHRQIVEALRFAMQSEHAWLLQYDFEEWESEANDLSDLIVEMFRQFRS